MDSDSYIKPDTIHRPRHSAPESGFAELRHLDCIQSPIYCYREAEVIGNLRDAISMESLIFWRLPN